MNDYSGSPPIQVVGTLGMTLSGVPLWYKIRTAFVAEVACRGILYGNQRGLGRVARSRLVGGFDQVYDDIPALKL